MLIDPQVISTPGRVGYSLGLFIQRGDCYSCSLMIEVCEVVYVYGFLGCRARRRVLLIGAGLCRNPS